MFNYKMANELEYAILSGVLFFIVGNPITYGIVGNILKLNTKISKQNYILVFIHSIVMALLMFVTMWLLDTYFIEAEEAVEAAVEEWKCAKWTREQGPLPLGPKPVKK